MAQPIKAEGVRSIDATTLTGTYQNVGTATQNPVRILIIKNASNEWVTVSWDGGTTDVFELAPDNPDTLDLTGNSKPHDDHRFLPVGSQFQVKHQGSVPTRGKIVIQAFY